jgi:RNA-splicing ligase RtcB
MGTAVSEVPFVRLSPVLVEIPVTARADMRVPARVWADEELWEQIRRIVVRCPRSGELAEEAPYTYKDVDRVVDVVHRAGLARRVARLTPLGVVKG